MEFCQELRQDNNYFQEIKTMDQDSNFIGGCENILQFFQTQFEIPVGSIFLFTF